MEQYYAVTVYDPDDAKKLAQRIVNTETSWPSTYVNEAKQTIFLGYGNAYEEAKDWLEAHAFGKWNVLVAKMTLKEYGPGHPAAVPRDPIEVLGARRTNIADVAWGNARPGNRKPSAGARKPPVKRKAPQRAPGTSKAKKPAAGRPGAKRKTTGARR